MAKKTNSTKQRAVPNGYRPRESEKFMNPVMTEYFRQKLMMWKSELVRESSETIQHLQEESPQEADLADRASLETDRSLELRTRDRERKLISKIDGALRRILEGSYGYCEETMEPITLQRLEARPIATLTIEAQERHERMERTHRDD
jgi:DnaK suppressor protein